MEKAVQELIRKKAARYIWWETPEEAMAQPARVVAQVMNLGTFEDAQELLRLLGEEFFRDALRHSEAGWFNAKSWHYWHYALGLCRPKDPVPAMPVRKYT